MNWWETLGSVVDGAYKISGAIINLNKKENSTNNADRLTKYIRFTRKSNRTIRNRGYSTGRCRRGYNWR